MSVKTIVMRPTTLMWLCGLLEGDGSFLQRKDCFSPRVFLSMVDADTVENFSKVFGVNVKSRPSRKENWKPYFVAQVGSTTAHELCKIIYPYMGQRRQQRISEMLDAIDGYLQKANNRGFTQNKTIIKVSAHQFSQEILDLHYLAGILEAEGSFIKSKKNPVIAMKTTDEDVIVRVCKIIGHSYRGYERKEMTKIGTPRKKIYVFCLSGERARCWMEQLKSMMSHRRQQQIETALSK